MPLRTDFPGMTVGEYCEVNGRGSIAKLARLTGTHWRTIRDIAQGRTIPSPRVAVAIEYATEGSVRAEKSLGLGPLRRQAERRLGKLKEMEGFRQAGN